MHQIQDGNTRQQNKKMNSKKELVFIKSRTIISSFFTFPLQMNEKRASDRERERKKPKLVSN